MRSFPVIVLWTELEKVGLSLTLQKSQVSTPTLCCPSSDKTVSGARFYLSGQIRIFSSPSWIPQLGDRAFALSPFPRCSELLHMGHRCENPVLEIHQNFISFQSSSIKAKPDLSASVCCITARHQLHI